MRYLDASALKLLYCHRLFHLKVIEGWKEKEPFNDVIAGSAIHRFCRERHYKGNTQAALEASMWFAEQKVQVRKPFLDLGYINKACLTISNSETPYRVINYGTESALVEQSFKVPLSPDWTFVGTIDELAETQNANDLVFNDFKTTGQGYDGRTKKLVLNSFGRSIQFLSYFWAVKKHREVFPESALAKRNFLGGVVTAVFLNKESIEVDTSGLITFSQSQLDWFEEELFKLLKSIPEDNPTGLFSNQCVSGRNYPCEMLEYCKHEKGKDFLKANFHQEEYKPLDWY